jgi:Mrp family chromosome partitioning ATPase
VLCNLDQIRLSGIARNVGLSELLTTQDPIRGHVLETQHPNLSLLPSGLLPPNPADLLSTQRMHKILVEAEQALHLVIIDGPPTLVLVLVLADSPLLAALSITAFSLSRPVRRARAGVEALNRLEATGTISSARRLPRPRGRPVMATAATATATGIRR